MGFQSLIQCGCAIFSFLDAGVFESGSEHMVFDGHASEPFLVPANATHKVNYILCFPICPLNIPKIYLPLGFANMRFLSIHASAILLVLVGLEEETSASSTVLPVDSAVPPSLEQVTSHDPRTSVAADGRHYTTSHEMNAHKLAMLVQSTERQSLKPGDVERTIDEYNTRVVASDQDEDGILSEEDPYMLTLYNVLCEISSGSIEFIETNECAEIKDGDDLHEASRLLRDLLVRSDEYLSSANSAAIPFGSLTTSLEHDIKSASENGKAQDEILRKWYKELKKFASRKSHEWDKYNAVVRSDVGGSYCRFVLNTGLPGLEFIGEAVSKGQTVDDLDFWKYNIEQMNASIAERQSVLDAIDEKEREFLATELSEEKEKVAEFTRLIAGSSGNFDKMFGMLQNWRHFIDFGLVFEGSKTNAMSVFEPAVVQYARDVNGASLEYQDRQRK